MTQVGGVSEARGVADPATDGARAPGLLTLDELRGEVAAGRVDTVLLAIVDMQGRLQGKRLAATHFLDEVVEHNAEGCNYLLAVDVDMNTVGGYAMSSWDRGYGDFVFRPDMATLRRVPWHEGTALVMCDIEWEDGSPVTASPRHILSHPLQPAGGRRRAGDGPVRARRGARRRRPGRSRLLRADDPGPRRPARLPAGADPVPGPERQLLQALRGRQLRAHRGRLGPRQPHLLAAGGRPRPVAAPGEPRAGWRRQPLPGAGRDHRRGPARRRQRSGARGRVHRQRLRVEQAEGAADPARGARRLRRQRGRPAGVRKRRGGALQREGQGRAGRVRHRRDRLGALPGVRADVNVSTTIAVRDPASEAVIERLQAATAADADAAVERAAAAFEGWRAVSPADRARLLRRLAERVDAEREELARLEMRNAGKPIVDARAEMAMVVETFAYYAGAPERLLGETVPVAGGVDLTFREPLGVVGLIVPWNFPLLIASWKLAPALAAGNAVVLKPAALTPLTALAFARLA